MFKISHELPINMLDKKQCIFVVDNSLRLYGTITDRDIRKALLNQVNKNEKVDNITMKLIRFKLSFFLSKKFLRVKKINGNKKI